MKTVKITIIALATVLTSCTSLFEPKKATSETKTELITKSLNIEVKANEVNVVNLNFENTTASFRVAFTKNGNESNSNFNVSMTNNLVNNQLTPIVFSGSNEYIKKYTNNQDIDDKAFSQTGTVFLNGKSDPNYNITYVNSFPLDESNYALFKVVNQTTKKEIYGWVNFTITTNNIIFHKMGYSNEKLTAIIDEQI
jgi:hypothetical protein